MLARLRTIYDKANFYRIKITYLCPQKTHFPHILSLVSISEILILPNILAKRGSFNNFDVFTSRILTRLRRHGKILGWVLG